jgi:inosose dehydratase
VTVAIANAPVSYGAFELTVDSERYVAPAEQVLDEVAAAGYAGIDLGPLGYLGDADQLGERLAARGLGLAGGYIELPFHDPGALEAAVPQLDALLEAFALAAPKPTHPPPRPTLAAANRSIELDERRWRAFGAGLARVVGRCRERGFEPTFHHHAGTFVEAPWEIERVLELSDVGLCLDTGHLLVGGGDPVAEIRRWAARINHVHLKDASRLLMHEIVATGSDANQIWTRGVFRALGAGDLDVEGVLAALREVGYAGWMVVEQDVLIDGPDGLEQAVGDQRANRQFLADRGW